MYMPCALSDDPADVLSLSGGGRAKRHAPFKNKCTFNAKRLNAEKLLDKQTSSSRLTREADG